MTTRRPFSFFAAATFAAVVAASAVLGATVLAAQSTLIAQDAANADPQQEFWDRLQALCESAARGRLLAAPAGDTQIDPNAQLVVHFRECSDSELRFPLHVDDNRSRTWVFIRHADGIELRHDHREADGSESRNTWYGASTMAPGTAERQDFVTVRNDIASGWRVEIVPGQRFTYGTARDGEWRHHLEFDLTSPVAIPPLPWGHQTRPSQRP